MKGQHINWCCSCDHKKKPTRAHPLEIESYKKQLAEANAKLQFMTKRRLIHKTPQTEMELSHTNMLISKLVDLLKPNLATKSTPQMVSQGTQTEAPPVGISVGTESEAPESSGSSVSSDTSDVSSETANLAGTAYLLLLNRTVQDPDVLAGRINTMSRDELERIIASEPPERVRRAEGQAGVMTLQELQQKTR